MNFFSEKTYNFNVPLAPPHCAKSQKHPLRGSKVIRMHHFLAQNSLFALKDNFFRKPITSQPCRVH